MGPDLPTNPPAAARSEAGELGRARFELGWHELATALFTACWIVALGVLVHAARLSFLVPRVHERNVLSLLSYRGLERPPDVLFLGSSRFHHGFHFQIAERTAERLLGEELEVYGLGLYGLRPWLMRDVVRGLVLDRPPRRALVLGIAIGSFERDTFEDMHGLRLWASPRDLLDLDWSLVEPEHRGYLAALPLRGVQVPWNLDWWLDPDTREMIGRQREHSGMLGRLEAELVRRDREARRRVRLATGLTAAERQRDERAEDPAPRAWFDDLDALGFQLLLEDLRGMPCPVLFVRTPVTPEYLARLPEHARERYEDEVVAAIRAAGFDYHDLNAPPFPRGGDAFRDDVHLSPEGRRRATRLFVHEILAGRIAR